MKLWPPKRGNDPEAASNGETGDAGAAAGEAAGAAAQPPAGDGAAAPVPADPPLPPEGSTGALIEDAVPGPKGHPPVASIFRVVAVVLLTVFALLLIWQLRTPLSWLVIAAFIAIAVSGPINMLERRMRRGFAIAIVYIGVILMPVLILAILLPPLVEQGDKLAENAPQYARDLSETVRKSDRLRDLDADYNITGKIREQAAELPGRVGDVAGGLASVGAGIVSGIFAGVTILLLSIFMVGASPRWRAAFMSAQPRRRARALDRAFDRTGAAVGNYVRGALLQALIAGFTSWLVLTILGVPYPLALSLVVFLLDLVPLIGATLGAIIVGIVTVFTDFPTATIVWTIWSVIYQQVENNIIQPRIQSKAVQVEPFVVLVSVLFGSTLFGVVGALLAIPAAATIQIAFREYAVYKDPSRATPKRDEPGTLAPQAEPGRAAPA